MTDLERLPVDQSKHVLVVFRWPDGKPDLQAVAHRLNASSEAFDETFGIVLLDPERRLWSVRARYENLPAELGHDAWIFADSPIDGMAQSD